MNTNRSSIVILVMFLGLNTYGQTCRISDANEFLNKIKANHQVNLMAKANEEILDGEIKSANQVYNPEVETEIVSAGNNKVSSMLKLTQTFELGGKRDSRKAWAQRLKELGRLEFKGEKEKAVLENILNLYRLRQIEELIPVYQESYGSLKKVYDKKSKIRKSLSPSQEVEYETLSFAMDDYYMRLSELKAEKASIRVHLKLNAGKNCVVSKSALPKLFKFKELNLNLLELKDSTGYKKRLAQLAVAKAEYDVAKSNAYSDLSVGPMYEYSKSDDEKEHAFGLSLTFDLPVFNTNDGAKAKGIAAVKKSEYQIRYDELDLQIDHRNWVQKYQRYKSVYKKMASQSVLEKKHKRIEKLFDRGVISTSLIIEAHRQMVDFFTRRNDYEIGAVEALWNIYLLRGTILEEQI
ncbi:outer membrane efflux protein [Bacteriovorax sp. BAL6_X]|uniref:TolC family protein n=1 Tax=Bacteriovorax sp. BAL6_X TaxID=1201290 RepID=UPI000385FA07|nr:TolC family protein [Bacteriovorax sp. BAL6_X]EPZ49933.1 outer membrane efflux protein [Bacteriovorax sp. BAL6_X]